MASKQNDLMLNILANPHMSLGDFQSVGLTADNTSLEDENVYTNSKIITENPLFQNASGEFDKVKFHQKYLEAAKAIETMARDDQDFQPTYSKYNIFAPLSQIDTKPQFELTKALNPDRLTKSMLVLGQSGPRTMSVAEIAQSQQVYNSDTGEWMDTPEDMFSFQKLFKDFGGFFSDNFGATKVLATYDNDVDINGKQRGEIGFDENLIEHRKGEYKLNENGTYYYRTLKDGEDIYGKQVLHYSDILTREGSALNAIDFLDSDDIEKSAMGSFVKNASLVGSFFLPYVGPAIAGATIFQQAAGLGAVLGKIALGNDNATLNWIEGLVDSTNPIETRSEHSQQENWTWENILGMAGDVIAQLYQQRMIFKYSPYIVKGKWGISEENQNLLKNKILADLEKESAAQLKGITNPLANKKAVVEKAAINELRAAAEVEKYMEGFYKSGEHLSRAYMTVLTVSDIYGEAKEVGADDFDASLITLGYAAMEYALLSTDIGKWVLPELRANRLENKAIMKALSKDTIEYFNKLRGEALKNEVGARKYVQEVLNFGKSIVKGEFASGFGKRASLEGGKGLLAGGVGSVFAGAMAEALEETSEEVLADFSRVLFNGLQKLQGKDTRLEPFENMTDRYAMSFLGGFLGGGVSGAVFDFSQARRAANMTYEQAVQQVIYKARNNQLKDLYDVIDNNKIGNDKLSARQVVQDEEGNPIWKQADGNDNQDFVIKQNLKRFLGMIQNTLDAHGGNLSDSSLLDAQTLRDIRYRSLHNSVTAGRYIQHYNELVKELVDNVTELKNLNSPTVRAEEGETDGAENKSPELEVKRKKIEARIKELDKQIADFNEGKLAPLFMTSALLESTPFISAPFMTSTFRYYAEQQAKTKFENIPEAELKKYLIDYQNYLRTTKKDDLRLATQGYLNMQTLIRDNFEQATKIAEQQANDSELLDYIKTFNNTISVFADNILQMDEDTWLTNLQNFAETAQVGSNTTNYMQLMRNQVNEGLRLAEEKRNKQISDAEESLTSGLIDEETRNNTINQANFEYDETTKELRKKFDEQKQQLLQSTEIEAAIKLADKLISIGYINGAIKSRVLAQLESTADNISKLVQTLQEKMEAGEDIDEELLNKLFAQRIELLGNEEKGANKVIGKIEQIKNLHNTPILQNLDSFALSLNGGNVSKILNELGAIINTNRGNLSAFTIENDVYKQLNEALRTIDLYIAALEGARTDNVDPFNVELEGGVPTEKANVWGINKVLNEVHAKAPKLENDTWQDLPEIDGKIADMMILDAKSIKNLLNTYAKLYSVNEGQKLNVQSRVSTKASYLIYYRIKNLLANTDVLRNQDFNTESLEKVLNELTFLKDQTSGDPKNWKLALSQEEQIKLEAERIKLQDAIYDFFNVDNIKDGKKLIHDVERLKSFLTSDKSGNYFNLWDNKSELLSEGATTIDDSSVLGYIVANAAIKSSDFYAQFKDIISDGKLAPLIGQELGVQLQLANILNGNAVTAFNQAIREVMIDQFKNAKFEERVQYLTEFGESKGTAQILATDEGAKWIYLHDSIPQYDNITFIDGIPGAGKSAAVDALVVKYLQRYHKNISDNAWVSHGGDTRDDHPFSTKFRGDIGLSEDSDKTINHAQLMKKISVEWNPSTSDDGKTFNFEEGKDYKFEDGKLVPAWKLNNLAENEIPSLIVIDEAQQFTQLELMLIDKFAKQHGIPVVMSGDLQQSKSEGILQLPTESVKKIKDELVAKNVQGAANIKELPISIGLSRNQTLHTFKLGTSMRTANNQKNANMAAMQVALGEINARGGVNINLHYFENESNISGDSIISPNQLDVIIQKVDKMISLLQGDEKIKYAYDSEDSELYKKLFNEKKYKDRIDFIKGTGLGQEGDYWIIEPEYTQDAGGSGVSDANKFLADLYTGITRSKKGGLVIVPNSLNSDKGQITLKNIEDQETHNISYSEQAVEKYAKRRVEVLDKALPKDTKEVEYIPRDKSAAPTNPQTPITPSPNPEPTLEPQPSPSPTPSPAPQPNPNPQPNPLNNPTSEEPLNPIEDNNKFKVGDILTVQDTRTNKTRTFKVAESGIDKNGRLWYTIYFNEDGTARGIYYQDGDLIKNYFGLISNTEIHTSNFIILNNSRLGDARPYVESDTEEENISEYEVSNETETQKQLENATVEENEEFNEYDERPIGGSMKDFTFFLFSNATFELGVKINSNGEFELSPIPFRIDGINGFKNCPNLAALANDPKNRKECEQKLADLRRYLLNTTDKSKIEKAVKDITGLTDNVFIRYAVKTSEMKQDYVPQNNFGKLEKESSEPLPYARAQRVGQSTTVNNRNLVAIIGTNQDAIEIPLLTLNNPITLLQTDTFIQLFNNIYLPAFNSLPSTASLGERQIYGLKAVLEAIKNDPNYTALANLIKLYIRTDKQVLFVPDQQWTPARDLTSFGPQLHIGRGEWNYENNDYIQDIGWVNLDMIKNDPTITTTSIYEIRSKTEDNAIYGQAKHPFILYTDHMFDHEGNRMEGDEAIIKEYMYQKQHKDVPQTVKLVYVLPPKYTIEDYINSLKRFMENTNHPLPLGNQRTAYKILETLFEQDEAAMRNIFKRSVFGEENGEHIANKIVGLISKLKNLSIQEQVAELKKVENWSSDVRGVGLTTDVNVYRHLQHIIKQLVFPGGYNIETNGMTIASHGTINQEIFDELKSIFKASGKTLYYQVKADRTISNDIEGIFAKVQTNNNGHIVDDNLTGNTFFTINGNISSSTFLAEEEFNKVIDKWVNQDQYTNDYGQWTTKDTYAYVGNPNTGKLPYSGWEITSTTQNTTEENSPQAQPSVHKSITDKLKYWDLEDIDVSPTIENDDSIELKQQIAQEINTKYTDIAAFVLPNGELLIGEFNHNNPIEFQFDNEIESGQQYQFTAIADNITYNVIYNPNDPNGEVTFVQKIEQSEESSVVEEAGFDEFEDFIYDLDLNTVEQNLNYFKNLLNKLKESNTFNNKPNDLAELDKALQEGTPQAIFNFISGNIEGVPGLQYRILDAFENDFDPSAYNNILVKQQEDNICPIIIKKRFL